MAGIKLQKRNNDFFVSYGHDDQSRVAPLVDLLSRVCGLRIWFDRGDGNASVRSSELLSDAIGNARGALFCLSQAWKRSTWCKNEYEVSLSEQRMHEAFEVICLRLDDVDPPGWFNVAEIIDLRQPGPRAIARLLCSLTSDVPRRFDNAEDVYLAASWSRPSPLARETFAALHRTGWRLVGDSPTFKNFDERRIEAIQRTTSGVVALLPHDPSQSGSATSPYILAEARIALRIAKPLLLLSEPGVAPPEDLVRGAFRGTCVPLAPNAEGSPTLTTVFDAFDDMLQRVPNDDTGAFIFYAASLRGEPSEADDIASVIERTSNMRCVRGERLAGDNVQAGIIDLIRRAAVLIADVSDDQRNTLIEAGIAMGAGTRLKLMCREPPTGGADGRSIASGALLKKRFMFEGQEFFWYRTPEERLGLCCYFARQFRRRIYVVR
jgi:hypothetical protein